MTLIYIIFIITFDTDLTFLMYTHVDFATVVPDNGGLSSAED